MRTKALPILLVVTTVLLGAPLIAQETAPQEQYSHWPEDLKINGRIIVNNGLKDPSGLQRTLQRIVGGKSVVCLHGQEEPASDAWRQALQKAVGDKGSFTVIASSNASAKLLNAAIADADCVFFEAFPGKADAIAELKEPLHALIQRGGTLIADATVAQRFGKHYVIDAESHKTAAGLNLLPDTLLDTSIDAETMLKVLSKHARSVGVRLENETALVLSGRKLLVMGSGKATLSIAKGTADKPASVSISAGGGRRRDPESITADLTQWRRMAIDRDLPPFPGEKPPTPFVENGTLIIVGGGGSPRGMMNRFVELAGGVEKARLVYVPCSENDDVGERHGLVSAWKRMGVKHATFIHTKDRNKSNTDEDFLAPLKDATGIFYGGGRQWNFSDSYYGTKAHQLMKDVLKRGGVIAGSSAGASIQGRYLARATPIGNFKIMAPGYERGGLGFLAGVAIDQHFTQRGRQKDMTQLIGVYPQLLGIGLDEATAIVVQKSVANVIGRGRVFFYDSKAERGDEDPDYVALPKGSTYDLAKREILKDAREKKKDEKAEEDGEDNQ